MFETLEKRLMLSSDWRSLPVYAQPVGSMGAVDTSAYDLIGSAVQRQAYGFTGQGYSVAIIDTGVDFTNPAISDHFVAGWDFVNHDAVALDDNGHGTHVAGIIASADVNYPGIATGVGIIALKVLDANGVGSFGNVDLALQWVAQHQKQYNIVAVNMSLGEGNYTTNPYTFLDADLQQLRDEGVFVAAAAGNDYFPSGSQEGLSYPAVDPLVVSVGAVWSSDYGAANWSDGAKDYTTQADQIASFSQRSPSLDVVAPGAYVTSIYLHDTYAALAGTSMATPMVVGSAVLVHQALDEAGKSATPADVLQVLEQTATNVQDKQETPAQDNVQHTDLTFPRIDVLNAVKSLVTYTPNQQYVAHLYNELLGRHPEASGLNYWARLLDGGLSRSVLVTAIWNSYEHLADEVRQDYFTILGREADEQGVAFWVKQMQAGWTNAMIQQAFYASDEFYKKEYSL